MAINGDLPTEVEVFGVTYERYALERLFKRLVGKYSIRTVLEMPASGAKAMPSLYSIGFALAGCEVTLVDAEEEGLEQWKRLNLEASISTLSRDEIQNLTEDDKQWDLCWNFMVMPAAESPTTLLDEMTRCSSRLVMMIHVNRYNVGFNMHRTVHRVYKIPWSHGDIAFFSPFRTKAFLKQNRIEKIEWGVVDSPPWPDSPGFRDLRLHRLGDQPKKWVSPYVDHLLTGQFPGWMKWVYRGERLPVPAFCKLPYSHLFYILGQVKRETN